MKLIFMNLLAVVTAIKFNSLLKNNTEGAIAKSVNNQVSAGSPRKGDFNCNDKTDSH